MDNCPTRILLIDDDEDQFVIVRRYLKNAGTGPYEIVWADAPEKAISIIGEESFNLCLLDYHLGEQTGIELLGHMRSGGFGEPVILLTGQGSFEMDLAAMGEGVSDFLEKGDLTPVLLERSIRYALENHRTQAALQSMNEELEERVRQRTVELHRSNQELERFAEMVAHDLRMPLAALNEQLKQARASKGEKEIDGGESARRLLDPVLHTTRNIELLVQCVLDSSSMAPSPGQLETVNLAEVVEEVRAELAPAIERLQAEIEVGPLPEIHGDRKQLWGLFENLLSNALKFTREEPPRIRMWARPEENQWLFAVRDNGAGIEEEDLEEVFALSVQTAASPAQNVRMGLALCRKIVLHHGGRIWLDSEPGEGSRVYFLLPLG